MNLITFALGSEIFLRFAESCILRHKVLIFYLTKFTLETISNNSLTCTLKNISLKDLDQISNYQKNYNIRHHCFFFEEKKLMKIYTSSKLYVAFFFGQCAVKKLIENYSSQQMKIQIKIINERIVNALKNKFSTHKTKIESSNIFIENSDSIESKHLKECRVGHDNLGKNLKNIIRQILNRISKTKICDVVSQISELKKTKKSHLVSDFVSMDLLIRISNSPLTTNYSKSPTLIVLFYIITKSKTILTNFLILLVSTLEDTLMVRDFITCHSLVQIIIQLYKMGIVSSMLPFSVLANLIKRVHDFGFDIIKIMIKECGPLFRTYELDRSKKLVNLLNEAIRRNEKFSNQIECFGYIFDNLKKSKKKNKELIPLDVAMNIDSTVYRYGKKNLRSISINWNSLILPLKAKSTYWWKLYVVKTQQSKAMALRFTSNSSRYLVSASDNTKIAFATEIVSTFRNSIFHIMVTITNCLQCAKTLIRISLKSTKREKEIVRILLSSCIQEKIYNPFYFQVLSSLTNESKKYRFILQTLLRDHLKQVGSSNVNKIVNLSLLMPKMLLYQTIHLSVMKKVDFIKISSNVEISFWRICFMHILKECNHHHDASNLLKRIVSISSSQQNRKLLTGIRSFIEIQLGPWLSKKHEKAELTKSLEKIKLWSSLLRMCRLADKVLAEKSKNFLFELK